MFILILYHLNQVSRSRRLLFSFTRYMKSCRKRQKLKCILGSVANRRKVSKSQQGWKKSDVLGLPKGKTIT